MTTNPITGIIHVTGEPDTGKTSFALSSGAMPEETVFLDDDIKGKQTKQQVEAAGHSFGLYVDLIAARKGLRDLDFHNAMMEKLNSIERNRYKVLVWDTWTGFERTIHPYVVKNESKFRVAYASFAQIHGGQQWQVADQEYEPAILDMLLNIAPLVFLCAHVKNGRVGDKVIPGHLVSQVRDSVIKKSSLRLFLRHNSNSQAPVGLVVKRLNRMMVSERGMQPVAVLPRRIDPCTWDNILAYWNNPVGDRALLASEIPSPFELSILNGTLTADQKDMLRFITAEAQDSSLELGEALASKPTLTNEQIEQAHKMHADNKTRGEIAQALNVSKGDLSEALPELFA